MDDEFSNHVINTAIRAIDSAIDLALKQRPSMMVSIPDVKKTILKHANEFMKDKLYIPSRDSIVASYRVIRASENSNRSVFPLNDGGDFFIVSEYNGKTITIYFENDEPQVLVMRKGKTLVDSAYNYKTERIRYVRGVAKSTFKVISTIQKFTGTTFEPCETGIKDIYTVLCDELSESFESFFIKK